MVKSIPGSGTHANKQLFAIRRNNKSVLDINKNCCILKKYLRIQNPEAQHDSDRGTTSNSRHVLLHYRAAQVQV